MARTPEQLEREANAVIKLVLSEMELLAAMDPDEACDPYTYNERRRRVVRKIWSLFKEAMNCAPNSSSHGV
jgi:hypothetical protein